MFNAAVVPILNELLYYSWNNNTRSGGVSVGAAAPV